MPKSIRHGNVVLCEYVGQGSANKPILINVFSGDIIVSQLPANLSFGLFIEIQRLEAKILALEVSLNRQRMVRAEMLVGYNQTGPDSTVVIPQIPIRIEKNSVLEVRAFAEGYAPTWLLKKKITQGVIPGVISPTVSQPPSEQSPPGAPAP